MRGQNPAKPKGFAFMQKDYKTEETPSFFLSYLFFDEIQSHSYHKEEYKTQLEPRTNLQCGPGQKNYFHYFMWFPEKKWLHMFLNETRTSIF